MEERLQKSHPPWEIKGLSTPTVKEEKTTSTLIPQVSTETAIPTLVPTVRIETATPTSQPAPTPVLLWEVQTLAVPKNGYVYLEVSQAGVFMMRVTGIKNYPSSSLVHYSITAFDDQTGERKWIKEGSYQNPPWGDGMPGFKVAGSELVLIGNKAFDPETGNLKWEVPGSIPFEGGSVGFPYKIIIAAQTAQDYVYLSDNPNGNLIAVDIKTGEMKWAKTRDDRGNLVNYRNLFLVEDTLYAFQAGGLKSIEALDRFTGELKWSYEEDFFSFIANQQGVFGLRGLPSLIVFHLDPFGKLQWESEIETDLAITEDTTAYLQSLEGILIVTVVEDFPYGPVHIYGMDETTGELLWSNIGNLDFQDLLIRFYSKAGNSLIVYVLSRDLDQELDKINILDIKTNEVLDSYPLPGKVEGIAFSEETLYVLIKKADGAGSILAIGLPE